MNKLKRLLVGMVAFFAAILAPAYMVNAQDSKLLINGLNLAQIAKVSSSRGGFGVNGLNDGLVPVNTGNNRQGGGNNRPQPRANIWVQYDWEEPVTTSEIGLFWWNFNNNVRYQNSIGSLFGMVLLLCPLKMWMA